MPYFDSVTIEMLPNIAQQIIAEAGSIRVLLLHGNMGTGKTTLVKALCDVLHVTTEVSSPTYAIINEYVTQEKQIVYHIDCYRLDSADEAADAGVGECINSGHWCFIEWADIIEALWPDKYVKINIDTDEDLRSIAVYVAK